MTRTPLKSEGLSSCRGPCSMFRFHARFRLWYCGWISATSWPTYCSHQRWFMRGILSTDSLGIPMIDVRCSFTEIGYDKTLMGEIKKWAKVLWFVLCWGKGWSTKRPSAEWIHHLTLKGHTTPGHQRGHEGMAGVQPSSLVLQGSCLRKVAWMAPVPSGKASILC